MRPNLLAAMIDSLSLGPSVGLDNLTMYPLSPSARAEHRATRLEPRAANLDYSVLGDALASGDAEITEISDAGTVPEIRFENRAATPVLLVDGEELLGAKQNRVINLTILVPARTALTIPVSCVEAGRWRARSRSFTSTPRAQYASGRARRMANVSLSMAMTGDRRSNQGDVWNDIAETASRLDAIDPAAAQRRTGRTERSEFADPREQASRFIAIVSKADVDTHPAVGLGEDVRLTEPRLTGAALVVDDQVVHLGAFAL
jgi:hypothetical protein